MKKYDMVVVGSGAGLMVLEEALNHGLSCAMVEQGKIGGTCLTKGCIPSKMLVYPADLIREIESSARVGVKAGAPETDWDVISRRMWEQIDFHYVIEENLRGIPNLDVYKGAGSFEGPDSMVIRYGDGRPDELIQGEKFILAAGARSFIPPVKGLESAGYITSESFFGAKFPAKPWDSLVIIGGGAISMEFAHIFSAFGTRVTVVERSGRILAKEEPEISEFVKRQLVNHGVTVLENSSVISAAGGGSLKTVTVENSITKSITTVKCEEIFIASGVRSNADTLFPEKAGVALDQNGWIVTNQYMETSRENIWALGDINGKYQFRHKANHEAQVLIGNLFGKGPKKRVSFDSVPWTIFTFPHVAHLGKTEEEIAASGTPYKTAKNHYSEVVGGIAMGYGKKDGDDGFVKMIVGEDKKILGVHIAGPQASVLLQPFVYLMNAGYQCGQRPARPKKARAIKDLSFICPQAGTYAPVHDSMVIHPSLNELTAWVFEKLD